MISGLNCAVTDCVTVDPYRATRFAEDVMWKRLINWTALGLEAARRIVLVIFLMKVVPAHWCYGQAPRSHFCLQSSLWNFIMNEKERKTLQRPRTGISFPGVTTRIIYSNQPMVSRLGLTDKTTIFISVLYLYKLTSYDCHYGDVRQLTYLCT